MKNIVWILIIYFLVTSCSDKELPSEKAHRLDVVISLGGLGDMGYNDLIMSGVMNFYEDNDLEFSLKRPHQVEDAMQIIDQWVKETQNNTPALLVLAGNEYESVLRNMPIQLNDNQQILLFESSASDLPKGVTTFRMNRYGISYLAGCMAQKFSATTIIAAMPDNAVLDEAIKGFVTGYNTYNEAKTDIIYLAKDVSGYNMPDSAYRVASNIEKSFIFPLAGGSNSGIYKYARETTFYLPVLLGMDVDCSVFADRVPFSIVLNIDRLVKEYLTTWLNGEKFPQKQTYGFNSDYMDIVINPQFFQDINIEGFYYDDYNYWNKNYTKYKPEAIEKEILYEASNH